MRITLINIQIAILLVLAFIVSMAAGGLTAMLGVGAGVGPAAVATGAYLLVLVAGALIGLTAFVIPLSLVAGSTLLFVSHDLSLAAEFSRTVRLGELKRAGGEAS